MLTGTRGLGRVLFASAAEISRRIDRLDILNRCLTNLNVSWTPGRRRPGAGVRPAGDRGQPAGGLALRPLQHRDQPGARPALAGDWDGVPASCAEAETEGVIADFVTGRMALARGQEWSPPPEFASDLDGDDLSLRSFVRVVVGDAPRGDGCARGGRGAGGGRDDVRRHRALRRLHHRLAGGHRDRLGDRRPGRARHPPRDRRRPPRQQSDDRPARPARPDGRAGRELPPTTRRPSRSSGPRSPCRSSGTPSRRSRAAAPTSAPGWSATAGPTRRACCSTRLGRPSTGSVPCGGASSSTPSSRASSGDVRRSVAPATHGRGR